MEDVPRVGDLEIDEDPEFQRKTWKAQRIAWCLMAAFVGAGLLGFFGEGPVSRATAGATGTSLRLSYDRFARRDSSETLVFRFGSGRSDESRLFLDAAYLDGVQIERIEPPPTRQEAAPEGVAYRFATPGGEGSLSVTVHLRLLGVGPVRGKARLDDGPEVHFRQFVYP